MRKKEVLKETADFYLDSNQLQTFKQCTPEQRRTGLLREIISAGLQSIDRHQTKIEEHHESRKGLKFPKEHLRLRISSTLLKELKKKCEDLQCYQSDIVSYFLNDFIDNAFQQEFVGNSDNKINLDHITTLLHTMYKEK